MWLGGTAISDYPSRIATAVESDVNTLGVELIGSNQSAKRKPNYPLEDTMMQSRIGDDILDTRDVDGMIEELQDLEDALEECQSCYDEISENPEYYEAEEIENALRRRDEAAEDFTAEDQSLLKELLQFKEELEDYVPDWRHGETLILESYREEYTQQFAEDIGAVGENSSWIKIDWEATAEELFRWDYTSAEIQGETYYVRAS